MPAKFAPSYVAKIKREVRRYQKERSKLIRKGVFENVPERISYRDLVSKYYTKREMNKRLKEMSLFTATKATKARTIRGKATTEYEIQKFRMLLGRERKDIERELTRASKKESKLINLVHDRYLRNLEARRNELSRNWRDIIGTRAGAQVMRYEQNRETLYSNYIQALFQDANELGFPQEKMDKIIQKLNTLSPRQFERMFNEDTTISYIFNYYQSLTDKNLEIEKNSALDALEILFKTIDSKVSFFKKLY